MGDTMTAVAPARDRAPVLLTLTPGGLPVCRRIAALLAAGDAEGRDGIEGVEIHGLRGRVAATEADRLFDHTAEHLRLLFAEGRPIVGVCAAAVLIRALAPVLGDKQSEPPVLALAEDGSAVVPLLGGHHGAHALARRIAGPLGALAAITTAGDLRFGVALDDPPPGWRLANPQDYKSFAGALLAGAAVRLDGPAPWLEASRLPFAAPADAGPAVRAEETARAVPRLTLRVTERAEAGSPDTLVYHPATLAVGVGAERDAAPEAVLELVRRTLAEHGLAPEAVAGIFSIDVKADEPAVHVAAAALGVPARFFDAATLEAEAPRLATPSEVVFRRVGCHGVAEGAALAAAGPEGVLIVPKAKSRAATCAVARAPAPLDATAIGRPRGRLAIVGLGPGTLDWRTPEAAAALRGADDIVGYGFYNDLAGPLPARVRRHDFPLGAEEVRARAALDLAAAGRSVVLVSSGDPGIYAMATLVFELLDRAPQPDWQRVAISVVPGISAFQAAASRVGAPMAHDLCLISLSDLLTPWEVILRRIEAAAAADFLIALYNPVSKKRRHQLADAVEILLRHRAPETPVVVARQLGREDEEVRVLPLDALTPDQVDMLTIVLIGSTETRIVPRRGGRDEESAEDGGADGAGGSRGGGGGDGSGAVWVYTPRGYAGKAGSILRGGAGAAGEEGATSEAAAPGADPDGQD